MWGVSSNYPSISSYADAERVYNNTKPLRGTTDVRPLDRRSINAKSKITKQGEDYVITLYRTYIVRYFKDGSVFISTGGWSTPSTRAALSCMSPFSAFSSKGDTAVAVRCGMYVGASAPRFILPSSGLLFKKNEEGKFVPVNPPPAVLRKTRVKRVEARAARKYFKQVPKLIEVYGAAFAGGVVIETRAVRFNSYTDEVLDEADASNIAMAYLSRAWSWDGVSTARYTNDPVEAVRRFWVDVYRQLDLIEAYTVELPYGEVP